METYSDHYDHNVNRAALEDEEVSLCDLPLTTKKTTITAENNSTKHGKCHPSTTTPPSSSDPAAEFFEFLTNLNSTSGIQCSAEEVIFSGQLLPFAPPRRPPRSPHSKPSSSKSTASSSSAASIRRRPEPVHKEAKATVPRCNSTTSIRPFRSHDYMRLNRNNSLSGSHLAEKYSRSFDRNLSIGKENRSTGLGNLPLSSSLEDSSDQKESNKLPWWLMLGLVRYPTDQVEMKDMKNRQSRRNYPSSFIPEPAPVEKPSLSGDDVDNRRRSRTEKQKTSNVPASIRKKSSSWRVLNVLSCKSHASVAVTTSFPTIPT